MSSANVPAATDTRQMKLLLLILGLALVRGIQGHNGHCEEHQQNISGSWHTIAVASNDASKIKKGAPFRISLHRIVANGNKLYGEYMERKNGKCSAIFLNSYKTDKENQYISLYSGANIFYFTHIKHDEYIMSTLYNYDKNGVTLVLQLFARHPVLREEIKEKFEEFCLNNKLNKKNIVYLTRYGKWSSIYLASSVQKRIEDGGDMKFSINNIEVRDHDVVFDLDLKKDGKCIPYLLVANKTEINNVLKVDYEGENTVYVEKAEPRNYVIFSTHNIQNGAETVVLELYGRTNVVKEKAKKSFENLCKKYGINKDNIIDMTKERKPKTYFPDLLESTLASISS
ncbi:uncharacterized protein [Petaurus breviceps papuanus]|uniref:uncharacterized protein n=1 Tax=Petaurus breviceps papuanus TaxID=3040969 RepID=UPI0036DA3DA5